MRIPHCLLATVVSALAASAHAADGDLDPSFGDGGCRRGRPVCDGSHSGENIGARRRSYRRRICPEDRRNLHGFKIGLRAGVREDRVQLVVTCLRQVALCLKDEEIR